MNKNVIQIGLNFVLITLLTLCVSIFCSPSLSNSSVYASSSDVVVSNLDNSISYNYISKPSHLAVVSESEFYLTDENKDIYKFKNNTLTLTSSAFRDLIDIYYYDNALYILKAGKIFKLNTITLESELLYENSTLLSNPKNIIVTRDAYFVSNANSFVFLSSNLANVVTCDKFEYNSATNSFDTIYNLYVDSANNINVLHKYASDGYTFVTKFNVTSSYLIAQISNKRVLTTDTDVNLKLSGYGNYYTISKEKSLFLINNDSSAVEFDTTSPLITSTTNGSSSYKSGKILNISDYFIFGNSALICDNNVRSNSVQRFNIQDNQLTFDALLIASCSSDIDRLYKPNDLSLFEQNYLYVLDSGNNRIIIKDLKNQTNIEISDQELNNPTALDVNINGDTYVISNTETEQKLITFNSSTTKTKSVTISGYNISDIQCGYDGYVYMLDSVNKKLLSMNKNAQITELVNLSALSFVGSTRIKLNASGNKIYLLADNTIYNIDLSQSVLNEDKFSPNTDKIVDFMLDYNNNLYCILENSSNEFYIKSIPSSAMPTTPINLPNIEHCLYENMAFDICSGIIYNCDKTYHKIETIKINNYFNILNDFKTDYSFKEHPTATGATIARVNQNCKTYKYPFYAGYRLDLAEGDKVIVINKTCALNDGFAYIMIANKETKNVLTYINKEYLTYDVSEEQTTFNKIKVWFIGNANVYLYYLPTGLEFEDSPESFKYSKTAKLNEEFKILGLACGYKDASDMQYYTVQLDNGDIVYLKACYAIDANSTKGVATFQPNAKVEKNSSTDKLTLYKFDNETKTYIATEYELQNGQEIQVMQDSKNKEENAYLHIKFEDNDGELVTDYYIEAKYVVYNDITWLQIIGIILGILAIILIIITSVIIYKNI